MKLSYCTLQYKKTEFTPDSMLQDIAQAQVKTTQGQRRYDGVEWLVQPIDALTAEQRQALGKATRQAGLQTPVLGSYIGHYNLAMTNRDEVLATAQKSFAIAHEMQTPLIRCFVGFVCECSSIGCAPDYWRYNVAGFRDIAQALKQFNAAHKTQYKLCLETHSQSLVDTVAGCQRFLDDVGSELVFLNLQLGPDMLRDGIQTYEQVAKELRKHIVHVHTQPDSLAGDAESLKAFRWLANDGYQGFFSVEGHPPWPQGKTGAQLAQERLATYTAIGL